MFRSSCITEILVIAMAVLAGGRASAQIDNRVNQGNAGTAGRALDSNSAVGSSGFNLTRPGMVAPGARANAIITGNVTGLDYFHANSPIVNNNQFREALPSATLSGFRSQSVGLSEVLNNQTQSGTFFFDRTQTVTDAGFIRAGLNQPGSSFLATPYTPPPQNFTSDDSSSYLLQRLPDQTDRRVSIPRPDFKPGVTQTPIDGSVDTKPTAIDLTPYKSAVGSSIFGTPTPSERPGPIGGLVSNREGLEDEFANLTAKPVADDPSLRRIDSLTVPEPPAERDGAPVEETPEEAGPDVFTMNQANIGADAPLTAPVFPLERPANLGEDRFADLYNAIGVADSLGIDNLEFGIPEDEDPAAADPTQTRIPASLMRETEAGIKQLSEAAKWASEVIDKPLRTFAGKYQNKLNEYMLAGEEELKRGQYYSAARYFELAHSIDPMNPLPLLSRGHALAAAGDYRSSVRFLTLGIERFPQIAAFRIDLPALLGRPDVFDIRRADLEDKLAESENRELRFLLGYLELYSGLPEEGIKNLRVAAKASPPDSVIGMFVDLITGQRELPSVGR